MAALAGVVAHGGLWGAAAEVGVVFSALAAFGFLLWRSSRKERANRSGDPGE